MKINLLAPLLALLLTACSGIPYNAGESHAKIASDLNINEQDITIISKCNFYPFQYGVAAYAKMRGCLFVEDKNSLIFVGYDNSSEKYTAAYRIELKDVGCAAIADQEPGKGIVYLYTDENAFTVALLLANNDLNHGAVQELKRSLISKLIPILDLSISVSNPLYRQKSSVSSACPVAARGA